MTHLSRRAYLAAAGAGLGSLAGCSSVGSLGTTGVIIEANTPALRDADPGIVLRGLDGDSQVQLQASAEGQYRTWRSSATFRADEEGVVRVGSQAPVSGDYEGVDGAGLLWSMAPKREALEPWAKGAFSVTLSASQDGTTLAERTLLRRRARPDVRTQWVTDENVVGMFADPRVDEPRPGIVVLHGSTGVPLTNYAEMFASHGFPSLALQYFGSEGGIPDHLAAVPLSYFDGAASWLRAHPSVRDGPLGVYGFSRGGEAALFLAANADWVGAVVGDVPSGLAWQGIRSDGRKASGSAWSIDGEPVPFVSYENCSAEYTDEGLRRDAAFYECGLANADQSTIDAATFAVENVDGPILCVSGSSDGVWPSARLSAFAVDRLAASGATDRIAHRSFQDAGHDIPIPHVPTQAIPTAGDRLIGGTQAGIAMAAATAWPAMLRTFATGLE